MNTEEIRAH